MSEGQSAPAGGGADAAEQGSKKKGGAVKKAAGKPVAAAATKAPPKPAAPKKVRVARPARGGVPFVCSECYEEFTLPATYARETVTCPECLHVGKRPDEKFLQTVTTTKARESGAFKMALLFTYMLIISALLLMWVLSPYSLSVLSDGDNRSMVTMVLLGLSVASAALLAWAANKYENNRWDVYF